MSREELAGQDYDLSFSRYYEEPYEETEYEEPAVILERLEATERDISESIRNLRELL